MKDEESQRSTSSSWKSDAAAAAGGSGSFMLGKGSSGYKFWALAAILLLALWSMLTGSVTLKWSAANLNPLSADFHSPVLDDLDILEVEEREKLVRHMWDLYSHSSSSTIRLPRFWLEAFEAAYEDLTSDVPGVKNAAFSEIARMSLSSIDVETPTAVQSTSTRGRRNMSKQVQTDNKKVTTAGTSSSR